jgi:ssDNA-binding Zn-finger/Zn-ribbon topoisomerase 1
MSRSREENNEYHYKYYHNNKQRIKQKQTRKEICPFCNSIVSKRQLKAHQRKTKKCKNKALREIEKGEPESDDEELLYYINLF